MLYFSQIYLTKHEWRNFGAIMAILTHKNYYDN
jgi:hypothetical protein